jgi:hypothetical protein
VVSFGHGAVPAGISQGSSIRGSLTFEPGDTAQPIIDLVRTQ